MALTDKLTAIANAIRAKTGKTESLTLEQMPTEIESIATGGGDGEKPFDCHSVTFMYGDTVLYVRSVGDGDTCADPVSRNLIQAPTKESTTQYDYTHNGWASADGGAADDTILQNVTEDKTVYAAFKETLREYTITFYDEDGTTVLATEQVAYGTIPSYTPTKSGLMFDGWTPTPVAVTGDASYTALWIEAVAILSPKSVKVGSAKTARLTLDASHTFDTSSNYRVVIDGIAYETNLKKITKLFYASSSNNNTFYVLGNPYKFFDAYSPYDAPTNILPYTLKDTGEPYMVKASNNAITQAFIYIEPGTYTVAIYKIANA